jgi:hypothetical protein
MLPTKADFQLLRADLTVERDKRRADADQATATADEGRRNAQWYQSEADRLTRLIEFADRSRRVSHSATVEDLDALIAEMKDRQSTYDRLANEAVMRDRDDTYWRTGSDDCDRAISLLEAVRHAWF